MRSREAQRLIVAARQRVDAEIASNASMYARGLASEGYAGGYANALSDVLLLLNGTMPDRRGYWKQG